MNCEAQNQADKETTMAHVITSKQSHERTPRVSRDAQYRWPAGATESYGMKWKPTLTDVCGIVITALALLGAASVIIKSIFG